MPLVQDAHVPDLQVVHVPLVAVQVPFSLQQAELADSAAVVSVAPVSAQVAAAGFDRHFADRRRAIEVAASGGSAGERHASLPAASADSPSAGSA